MSHFVTVEFAFNIGEVVWHRAAVAGGQYKPHAWIVIERHAVQCHGGVQKFYKLNDCAGPMVPELALTSDEPPPASRVEWCMNTEPTRKESDNADTDTEAGRADRG